MSKVRIVLSIVLIGLLAFGAGMGTLAFYTKSIGSNGNTIAAANFEVSGWNGTIDEEFSTKFEIGNLAPGQSVEYPFTLDTRNTEVPVIVDIDVDSDGDLFDAIDEVNSPVTLSLVRMLNGNQDYEVIAGPTRTNDLTYNFNLEAHEHGAFEYAIICQWPWQTTENNEVVNDNLWAGTEGTIDINVTVQQNRENILYTHVFINKIEEYRNYPEGKSNVHLDNAKVEYDTVSNEVTVYDEGFENGYYIGKASRISNGKVQIKVGNGDINIWVPENIANQF